MPRSLSSIVSLLALALVLTGCRGEQNYTIAAYDGPARPTVVNDWQQVFSSPVALKVTAFVTGRVLVGPEILIDADDERVPEKYHDDIWVPSLAYLVEHPSGSSILLDAGLRAGNCSYGRRPVYWIECRNSEGSDAASQLAALGFGKGEGKRQLDYVMISHFHGDHSSGLDDVLKLTGATVVTTETEIGGVQSLFGILSGYEASQIPSTMKVATVDERFRDTPVLGAAADFFGDGSLWLLSTPGHTRGHLSALLNTVPTPVLLTFDASHLQVGFDLGVVPGFTADREAAEDSLERLRNFAKANPGVRVLSGHEPTQWEGESITTGLL